MKLNSGDNMLEIVESSSTAARLSAATEFPEPRGITLANHEAFVGSANLSGFGHYISGSVRMRTNLTPFLRTACAAVFVAAWQGVDLGGCREMYAPA